MNVLIDNRQITEEAENTGIYAAVKALVKAHELPPNTRLLVSQLSAKMEPCGEKAVRDV